MTVPDPLADWLPETVRQVEVRLGALFRDTWPARLGEALRYPLQTGGKRFRPALVLAAFEGVAGRDRESALVAAVAVELVHTYSLVHDDLPAMDDDDVRRGAPTVHRAFDEPTAILVGDALLTEAFAQLASAPAPPAVRVELVRLLAEASGHLGMVGGQAGDIAGSAELEAVHSRKTGALIRAAAELGAVAGEADSAARKAIRDYGAAVGLAFQLADDLLDADEDSGTDGPPSYVKHLGKVETARRARELVDRAIASVADLPRPHLLQALAELTVARRA